VYAHPDCTVIVQNHDDWNHLLQAKLLKPSQLLLIPGSGVDLAKYADIQASEAEAMVLLPARLLTDKGVPEFVQAARSLRSQGCGWRFVLAGEADAANPAAIAAEQVKNWVAEGVVEWWGHRHDMPAVFARAGIVCLPSHREGMPKALLEAAMAGKPVVTTDAVGCREAILPGESGLLVPVGDAGALAEAIRMLIDDAALRERFGARGRALAAARFTQQAVIDATFGIYESGHGNDADG
jgi:glycosyltransferase involved in cell wall biosynthesis